MSDPAAKTKAPSPASSGVRFDADAACDRCGVYGAYVFADTKLCGACYEGRGACCAESEMPECTEDDATTRAAKEATGTLPGAD